MQNWVTYRIKVIMSGFEYQIVLKIMPDFRINVYSWINEFKQYFNQSKYGPWTLMPFCHQLIQLFMLVQ